MRIYPGCRSHTPLMVMFGIICLVLVISYTGVLRTVPLCVGHRQSSDYHITQHSSRDHDNYRHFSGIHDNLSQTPSMYPLHNIGLFFHRAYYDGRQTENNIRIFGIHRNDSKPEGFRCEWNSSHGITWQVSIMQIIHNKYILMQKHPFDSH